ncbi:Uncharacterized protein QJS10_CPB04g00752 [Acorus calamus]|uniref:At4g15545-like C-terminal domain-containing protein n=1 Tax=Acorus calamus TaxID=4465 RepID=A0AAV9EXU6_ACOCL|nr:Uncharacterized protein QJS10_CPB04g00752 [Acorus calamus]
MQVGATPSPPDFDLPETVLSVLPDDPFEQLDVARKITSIALATRVSKLESESSRLFLQLQEKDQLIQDLQSRLDSLDSSLADLSDRLAQAEEEKESLLAENQSLSNTVRKLNRDVSKVNAEILKLLEIFKKTLAESLQDEEDGSHPAVAKVATKAISSTGSLSSGSFIGDDASLPSSKSPSSKFQFSETGVSEDGSSIETDASKHNIPHGLRIASHNSTPKLTPPGSPPRLSAARSPTKLSKAVSPRRHSISFATSRNMFEDRSSMYSSMPTSRHNMMTSPFDTANQAGRNRMDGKEFFRQVRSRLSYEQFSSFLANVKELNSHKQTREDTLRKADEIFGPDNKDLYDIFEGLITRNLH